MEIKNISLLQLENNTGQIPGVNQMKKCTKCFIEKEYSEFNKSSKNKSGLRAECRNCEKLYYQQNKERLKLSHAEYRSKNKIKKSKTDKEYREKNKDKLREYFTEYRIKNKDKKDAYYKEWRSSVRGKECRKAHNQNRKALQKKINGTFNADDISVLYHKQKGTCVYCKTNLNNGYHIDHIFPLSKGGNNSVPNLQLLCPACNMSKNNRLPEEFAQKFGMLI